MNSFKRWSKFNKYVFLPVVLLVTSVGLIVGQTPEKEWQDYVPDKALFSMRVPGVPSADEGSVFEPEDEKIAHRFFVGGVKSKVFSFQIKKGTKRSFTVSILYVQTKRSANPKPVTVKEADIVDNTIGDEIIRSKIESVTAKDGIISKWTYGRQVGSKIEDRGRVFVKRTHSSLVIVVVDYDYAKPDDPDIGIMLDSIVLR